MIKRLREALPPINDDWSESGGDVEPGAEYEVDYVEPPAEADDTWVRIVDDSGVVRVMRSDEHVPGSAEMEATLNDTKPAPMDF